MKGTKSGVKDDGRRASGGVSRRTATVLLAFLLTRYTALDIIQIYFCVQFIDILKLIIGLLMLRSNFWARNVVSDL
jgi:Na+-driven multidrug efflux pump